MRAILGAKHFLFVAVVAALPTCSVLSAFAGNHGYRVLYNFCSLTQCTDGAHPAGVMVDSSGNLLGVAYPGGDNNYGAVFELTRIANRTYSESVLYSFCSEANCLDGALPMGSLIHDKAGNLYGTTHEGGANDGGEVFELVQRHGSWKLKILYSFCSRKNCADGRFPQAGLTYAGALSGAPYDGSSPLFGTTGDGGTGSGVAYELQRRANRWTERLLYSFCSDRSCSDGAVPTTPLIVDNSANLYGTTSEGGSNSQGTVFALTPNNGAWSETVLHSFCTQQNCPDGALPLGGLAMDGVGTLYGFANAGGIVCADTDHGACGLIYSIAVRKPAPQYTIRYTFGTGGRADDGANPSGSPVLDGNGNLFGTTMFGGTGFFGGVAFELTGPTLKVLHTFCANLDDGCQPNGIVQDKKGRLFGATDAGGSGTDSNGTVFEIKTSAPGRVP